MNVPQEIIDRYDYMLAHYPVRQEDEPGTSPSHLRWMLSKLNKHDDPEKAMRWLGFIQGILTERGRITVTEERNFTRGKFYDPNLRR